ncbi:MAG: type IV pilus assembly protein PilM [Limisphaerales bacterium]
MLNSKSFLAIDFGAGTLKLAEFEVNETGGLKLVQYGTKALGSEGAQESSREQAISRGLQELLSRLGGRTKATNVCAPGFHVFSKFVKLPPVDTGKVGQIIEYEARQNVPFPLEEVVWDYQIVGTTASGELEVLLVAIKTDVVDGLFRVGESAGLRLQLVDVSSAALCNAFRYNYGDLEGEGCSMLLDIGAKTSNLLFFEKGKFYARSINIGANAITQDFANESKLKFDEAEAIKLEKGFVSLGGAYEEPEDPQAAAISKIARQVMTRLHLQVNQTIQFYRGQQGGSAPQRLFLAGGASVMAYTAQFFAEKLNIPVDYFNPFRNVQIDPAVNVEELARVAHSYGEVVGLGLRNLAHCPVELNLMPDTSIQRQEFQQKKPILIAAMFTFVAIVFAVAWFHGKAVAIKEATVSELRGKTQPLVARESTIRSAQNELNRIQKEIDKIVQLAEARRYWPELMNELRRVMVQAESKTQQKIGSDVGLWIEIFGPAGQGDQEGQTFVRHQPEAQPFDGPQPVDSPSEGQPEQHASQPLAADGGATVETLAFVCRGVDLEAVSPTANADIAYALKAELEASPYFDKQGISLEPITKEEGAATFSFGVRAKLKKPFIVKYGLD